MANTTPSHYLYITFLLTTLYFVASLAARSEEDKVKIGRLVNYTVLNSFYTQLLEKLTAVQLKQLQRLVENEFSFKTMHDFFANVLGEDALINFSLDCLEFEFRSAVKAALESLKGDAREQFKKELFKEYDKYRLTDI